MRIISRDTIFTFFHTIGWFSTLFLLSVKRCINVAEWEHWMIRHGLMRSNLKSFPRLPRCTFPLPEIYSAQIHQACRKNEPIYRLPLREKFRDCRWRAGKKIQKGDARRNRESQALRFKIQEMAIPSNEGRRSHLRN